MLGAIGTDALKYPPEFEECREELRKLVSLTWKGEILCVRPLFDAPKHLFANKRRGSAGQHPKSVITRKPSASSPFSIESLLQYDHGLTSSIPPEFITSDLTHIILTKNLANKLEVGRTLCKNLCNSLDKDCSPDAVDLAVKQMKSANDEIKTTLISWLREIHEKIPVEKVKWRKECENIFIKLGVPFPPESPQENKIASFAHTPDRAN
jgi:hypothetical protein